MNNFKFCIERGFELVKEAILNGLNYRGHVKYIGTLVYLSYTPDCVKLTNMSGEIYFGF